MTPTPEPEPEYVEPLEFDPDDVNFPNINFDALNDVSEDIVAWLYLPDSEINYPVTQTTDNDYYLTHLADGTYNLNGSCLPFYLILHEEMMPYKIYTYEDPYKIDQTDFWNEISMLPHFCVSRTLVNGLKDVMQDSIHGLICPLDNLVDHQDVFQRWTNNISLQVQQYSALTAIFNRLVSDGRIDENFYMALVQNQTHFLEAIRLFVELGIPASSLDSSKGNQEQKLFVDVLTQVQKEQLFQFPETPNKEKLKSIIDSLAVDELDDYYKKKNGTAEGAKWYNNAIKVTKQQWRFCFPRGKQVFSCWSPHFRGANLQM